MKKILFFIGIIFELLCLTFSVRIILPLTKIIPASNSDLFGCALLLPYALILLLVGFIISLVLIYSSKKLKNKFLLNFQKIIIFLYLVLKVIFIIFLILNNQ